MTGSRRLGISVWVLATAALVSACTSGESGDSTVTQTPSTSTPPLTTAAVRSSTSSTATSAVPLPASSLTPSTSVDEIAVTKEAVAAAAVQSRQDYLYAVRNYDASDAIARLESTTAANSPSFEVSLSNIETLRSNGWRSRENPDVPSTLTVEGDVELLNGPPATRAELTTCVIDSGVVYEPGGAPDGSDTIVNDEIIARRNRITMVLEDGAWKVFEGTNVGTWNGETACPAA